MNPYIIILTTSEYEHACRTMAAFLDANGLDPADGRTIVIGSDADEALLPTTDGVLLHTDQFRSEPILDSLAPLCKENLILFPYSEECEELAVRLSVRCSGTSLCGVKSLALPRCSILDTPAMQTMTATRSIWGGHLTGTFALHRAPFFLCLDKGMPEADPAGGKITQTTQANTADPLQATDAVFHPEESSSGLSDAKFVAAGGRGLRNKANAEEFTRLANEIGAAAGASRPACMNAWFPMECLIGVSGNMIAPETCIVCAASGAPAFYSGIEKSQTIIAINNDENAPIMKKADAFACADWKAVLTELARLMK